MWFNLRCLLKSSFYATLFTYFTSYIYFFRANLSETYFTNRQDRYILFEHCKELADFLEKLIQIISSCSFQLKPDGNLALHDNCTVHPAEGSKPKKYIINFLIFRNAA